MAISGGMRVEERVMTAEEKEKTVVALPWFFLGCFSIARSRVLRAELAICLKELILN